MFVFPATLGTSSSINIIKKISAWVSAAQCCFQAALAHIPEFTRFGGPAANGDA